MEERSTENLKGKVLEYFMLSVVAHQLFPTYKMHKILEIIILRDIKKIGIMTLSGKKKVSLSKHRQSILLALQISFSFYLESAEST